SALTYLGGKLVLFLHSSILSDVGASTKPGAVQRAYPDQLSTEHGAKRDYEANQGTHVEQAV
ncbi:hypothetical protein, partial [Nitrosospira multiformis]|uniref:hypothetical protein n=1 Tax=Nitrosospira multiformis TaxID=1231 RepID=UPI001C63305C